MTTKPLDVPDLPDPLGDDGYPTDDYLDFIRDYRDTQMPVLDFIDYLRDGWNIPDWGFKRDVSLLCLSTGGWSGNESIIEAMLGNTHIRALYLRYIQWNTGGHYIFEIKEN